MKKDDLLVEVGAWVIIIIISTILVFMIKSVFA